MALGCRGSGGDTGSGVRDAVGINSNYWFFYQKATSNLHLTQYWAFFPTPPHLPSISMKFSKFLKYLLDNKRYRLKDLAEKSAIHDSDLSKIINGKRAAGSRAVGPILSALNEEHRPTALANWLTDQIPPQHPNLVHIVRAESPMTREEVPDLCTLEGALTILRVHAESNEALRVALMSMARAFSPA